MTSYSKIHFRSVHDGKATSMGVEKSRIKAEIDFNGRSITKAYLNEHCQMDKMLQVSFL